VMWSLALPGACRPVLYQGAVIFPRFGEDQVLGRTVSANKNFLVCEIGLGCCTDRRTSFHLSQPWLCMRGKTVVINNVFEDLDSFRTSTRR
jgi:hypothetical protein